MGIDVALYPNIHNLSQNGILVALHPGRHKGGLHQAVQIFLFDSLIDFGHQIHVGLRQGFQSILVSCLCRLEKLHLLNKVLSLYPLILRLLLYGKKNLSFHGKSGEIDLLGHRLNLHPFQLMGFQRIAKIINQGNP